MANQYTKKKLINEKNRKEIFYNLINAGLAGSLVFLGGLMNGGFSWKSIGLAFVTALIVVITKFQHYWKKEEKEYTKKVFNFIG